MKIQVYSDIHLEHLDKPFSIEPKADYLFLAGDIGSIHSDNLRHFFDDISKKYKKVFYVLGNHEYYNNNSNITIDEMLLLYRKFFKCYDNVYFLEKDRVELEGYIVLGCTLWTHADQRCQYFYNDFRRIRIQDGEYTRMFTVKDHNRLYSESLKWLKENYDPEKPTIIMTHHPTTSKYIAHPMFDKQASDYKTFFSSDVNFSPKSPLICISGHTHYSFDFGIEGTRYIANQKGYDDEAFDTKCNHGVFEL